MVLAGFMLAMLIQKRIENSYRRIENKYVALRNECKKTEEGKNILCIINDLED